MTTTQSDRDSPQATREVINFIRRAQTKGRNNAFPSGPSLFFERNYYAAQYVKAVLLSSFPILANIDSCENSKELWCVAFKVLVNGVRFRRAARQFFDACSTARMTGIAQRVAPYTISYEHQELHLSDGDVVPNYRHPFHLVTKKYYNSYDAENCDNYATVVLLAPLAFANHLVNVPRESYTTFHGLLYGAYELTTCRVSDQSAARLLEAARLDRSRILSSRQACVTGLAANSAFLYRRVWPLREFLNLSVDFDRGALNALRMRNLFQLWDQLPIYVEVNSALEETVHVYLCKRNRGGSRSMLTARNRASYNSLYTLFQLFVPLPDEGPQAPIVQIVDALATGKLSCKSSVSLLWNKLTDPRDVPQRSLEEAKVTATLKADMRTTLTLSDTQQKTLAFQAYRSAVSAEDEFRVYFQKAVLDLNARVMLRAKSARVPHHYGGVIANETGTGKTLSLLLWSQRQASPRPSCVFVVPDQLISHWQGEVKKYFDDTGAFETYDCRSAASVGTLQSHPGRCVIVSHSFLRHRRVAVCGTWTDLVIDEAHRCKGAGKLNQTLEGIHRRNTWPVTATPQAHLAYLTQLLQVPTQSTIGETLIAATVLRRLLIRGALERKHMTVTRSVVYCETTPQEKKFFRKIRRLVNGVSAIQRSNMKYLNRFFRILERVSSGGAVHGALMLAVLKRVFDKAKTCKRAREVSADENRAPEPAIGDKKQECAVCMSELMDPLQLACRHVFCTSCVQGMADVGHRRCPLCRAAVTQYYVPVWEAKDLPANTAETKSNQGNRPIGAKRFARLLQGGAGDASAGELLLMNGKRNTFRRHIGEWWSTHASSATQLLVFVKYAQVANEYAEASRDVYPAVRLAGFGQSTREAVADIDAFKQGRFRVLILSTKYCAGFDLVSANEVWLMNTDLKTCKMDQSLGRVVRMSQSSRNVAVKVFLYQHTFDDFTWTFRHLGEVRYTKSNLILLEYFFSHRDWTSKYFKLHNELKRTYPQVLRSWSDVTAKGGLITFRGAVTFNTRMNTFRFVGIPKRYLFNQFLQRGDGVATTASVLRKNKERVDKLNTRLRVY